MSERARRSVPLAVVLLLVHCAWQRPGVGVALSFRSDDADGPRMALDAGGHPHALERVTLDVRSVSLVPCPEEGTRAWLDLGPAVARAHSEETVLGPLSLELTDPQPLPSSSFGVLTGQYCDLRLTVDGIAIRAGGGTLSLEARVTRDVLLRMPRQALDAAGREAHIVVLASTTTLLDDFDPTRNDREVAAIRALGAALRALRVTAE